MRIQIQGRHWTNVVRVARDAGGTWGAAGPAVVVDVPDEAAGTVVREARKYLVAAFVFAPCHGCGRLRNLDPLTWKCFACEEIGANVEVPR